MLSDSPYTKVTDNGRRYDVWVLHDVYNNTFADIANNYGISMSTVVSDYYKILSLKMKCYVHHLSIMHGYQDITHFRKLWVSAYDCYRSLKYVVAYFEKEYHDILSEYRNGMPGMLEQILQDLPPLRNEFSKRPISSVIRLRETDGMTYAAIGKKLCMTKEKAEDLYNHYYYVLYCQLAENLMEITGDKNLREKYRKAFQIGSGKKKYDCIVKDYPELCEYFMKSKRKGK